MHQIYKNSKNLILTDCGETSPDFSDHIKDLRCSVYFQNGPSEGALVDIVLLIGKNLASQEAL